MEAWGILIYSKVSIENWPTEVATLPKFQETSLALYMYIYGIHNAGYGVHFLVQPGYRSSVWRVAGLLESPEVYIGSFNSSCNHTRTAFGNATICPWYYVINAVWNDLHITCLSTHWFLSTGWVALHTNLVCHVFSWLFYITCHVPTVHRGTHHIALEFWEYVCMQLVVSRQLQRIDNSLSDSQWGSNNWWFLGSAIIC